MTDCKSIPEWQSRTELIIGRKALKRLADSNVMVVGLGGVGAYAAENICRAGVGNMTIVDGDFVHPSNINRQLIASHETVDNFKSDLVACRLKSINPELKLKTKREYITEDKMEDLVSGDYDYIVDAIDTLSPKLNLIINSLDKNIMLVSSMGAGGKTDPTSVIVTDISKSFNCKLARVLRKKLHRKGIYEGFKVVFSSEKTSKESVLPEEELNKKSIVGTISYMPAVFGCVCAGVVIRDLIEIKGQVVQ